MEPAIVEGHLPRRSSRRFVRRDPQRFRLRRQVLQHSQPLQAANPDGARGPASRVHVDYTVDSGPRRARDALGAEEVDRVLAGGGRIVQINVWRPISGPVRRAPLALADAAIAAGFGELAAEAAMASHLGLTDLPVASRSG